MANPKILIVDDEPFNVDYLEQELEELGYETIAAFDGKEALDKVQSEVPDLVLLDIMMPIMDGFEVLSQLRANPSTRDIPVVVISASNSLQSVVKGIQLGAEDYLPKPFEPTLLKARISSSLEKKQLRDLQKLYLKSLEREFEIAREIQMGFLPSQLPALEGWEIGAYFKAAREVAGDFYDAFLLPDGNLVFVVGDVCGKGVGAALFMTLFRSLIRTTSTTDYFRSRSEAHAVKPAERLQHVVSFTNNYLADTHSSATFATIFIGYIDLQAGRLTYINGGNDPPLLLRNGGVIAALQPTGPIVGAIPDAFFGAQEICFGSDEMLVAFTDGIMDALNSEDEFYGMGRLLKLLEGAQSTPGMLLREIEQHLQAFIGAAEQFDDITVLAVKRKG